ncbi:MAG: 3-oxoacyl-[acyl-carrier-protein] reductase [Rhodospirillales bacterium]|nr:3-oxoacyl-[acyl-carrier-protein] reductase [Rhodospirillales bacterium]
MFDLTGKCALVTGASGGIGRAIAMQLKAQGAVVALSGTRVDALQALADELGDGAHVVAADLSSPEGADQLIAAATAAMGRIDILVNNAGLTRDTLAMRMKDTDWQLVLDVNLTSAFRLSKACLRGMMKARWGRIIGITSIVGVTGNAGQTNYAASKAGLIGMSKSLAQEVASRGITVNCIAPGFIATPMTEALTEDQQTGILNAIPAGKMGTPEDIASSVVYLASDEAAYVTGQTLHVNGGMAMI